MARVTGLEPAASGVTGRRSNQLSYTRAMTANFAVAVRYMMHPGVSTIVDGAIRDRIMLDDRQMQPVFSHMAAEFIRPREHVLKPRPSV
jgi:hypothetical protein